MNRMLSKAYVDRAHPECRFGCCAVRERHTHGGHRDGRVRCWSRAADESAWRREAGVR